MALKTYKAKIHLKNGAPQEVRVSADSITNAKQVIDMQYGNPRYILWPEEVKN